MQSALSLRRIKMQHNLTAEQVLGNLIKTIENNLGDIRGKKFKNEYIVGEWYAYIECLEAILCWKKAKKFGLDYNPEIKFNII